MTKHSHIKHDAFVIWLQAVRPFSFTASMVPVLLGAALGAYFEFDVIWPILPLVVTASLLIHAGTNLMSDYYDFKKGVDKDYTFGSSGVLTNMLLSPKKVFIASIIAFAAASAIGLILVVFRGTPMLIIGIVGLAGGILYTAKPINYKYFAAGDIFVFILMGPLMVIGSFLAMTGKYTNNVLLISLPVGFLVTAILHANNLRDITHDKKAGIKTLAIILGHKKAILTYHILIAAAFISILLMMAIGILPLWSIIVFLSAPIAIKNIKSALNAQLESPQSIATLDVQTAQFHLTFGVLLIASILLGTFI